MEIPVMNRRFRVAFSFAGEEREYVAKVAVKLAGYFGGQHILYDKFHEAELAGHDAGLRLPQLYIEQSDLIVPVFCPAYDPKRWTGWEWDHIYGLLTSADGQRVMLSRLKQATVRGLTPATAFIELDNKTPDEFAILILERLALNERKPKDHYTKDCVNAEKHTVRILHVQWDIRLAEEIRKLLQAFGIADLQLVLPSQCRVIPRRDFLIALLSPNALVDPEFRSVLGTEVGHRDPLRVDAVVYGAGCQREDIKEFERFFDVFELEQDGVHRLLEKLQGWLLVNHPGQVLPNERPLGAAQISTFINACKQLFDNRLDDPTRILHKYSQHRPDLDRTHHPATHYIYATADDLSNRVVRIVNARDMYKHDTEALSQLRGGDDYYYATHTVSQNAQARLGVLGSDMKAIAPELTDTHSAYQDYVAAQRQAAQKGVKVERIYIVPSLADLHSAARGELRIEMEDLDRAGVSVYVLEEGPGLFPAGVQRDFVIISGKCLGRSYPENAPMAWSDYLIGGTTSGNTAIEEYVRCFNVLKNNPGTQRFRHGESSFAPSVLARTPVAVERTGTRIHGTPGERLMVVLRTNGCAYDKNNRGCTMCDFKRHAIPAVIQRLQSRELHAQLESALNRPEATDITHLDMLVLGSFLDANETPEAFWRDSLAHVGQHPTLKRVLVESRVPYIREESLRRLKQYLAPHQRMEIGIGVETANAFLRNNVLNKSLKWNDLEKAVNLLAEYGFGFVAYILIKPQTLSESEALDDAVQSAEKVAELARGAGLMPGEWRLAFEPVFITRGTVLEEFWNSGMYELVNLWTVVEVAKRTRHLTDVFVGLSDEGLSDGRRPKACDDCTANVTDALQRFNRSNELREFEGIQCDHCLRNLPWR
jgi:radical SAM enzyme (TIGR01210 family)